MQLQNTKVARLFSLLGNSLKEFLRILKTQQACIVSWALGSDIYLSYILYHPSWEHLHNHIKTPNPYHIYVFLEGPHSMLSECILLNSAWAKDSCILFLWKNQRTYNGFHRWKELRFFHLLLEELPQTGNTVPLSSSTCMESHTAVHTPGSGGGAERLSSQRWYPPQHPFHTAWPHSKHNQDHSTWDWSVCLKLLFASLVQWGVCFWS